MEKKSVYLLSLGCPRNLLDSEVLLGLLKKEGFVINEFPEGSDIAIVNTCGFIQDAKQESVDMILALAEMKKAGKIKKIVVCGCLSQRYPKELKDEIAEIDGLFGPADFKRLPLLVDSLLAGEQIEEVSATPDFLYDHLYDREILTESHYAYVKIQEGCSNRCSYCVIPDLKGPRRSREISSVVEEVKALKKKSDIKELILIGQDTTSFGIDRSGKSELAELLREVSPLMEGKWLRLLYAHPAHFTDELIDVIAGTPNICKYVDLPVQHANDMVLKKMNRRVSRRDIELLVGKIRDRIDNVSLRTSIIVGFPGETEKEFSELIDFLKETMFERLGAFIYSREEGTPAYGFSGHVPDELKKERFDEVMKLQQNISAENNLKFLDSEIEVLIDEEDPAEKGLYLGRTWMDAPEVDGTVHVKGGKLAPGDFADVRITGTFEYDLMGEVI